MQLHEMEEQLKNLDARTTRIEQILPTLVTKDDLRLLATKEDLRVFVTREEFLASQAETRRHAVILTESVRDDIRLLAEYVAGLGSQNRK